MDKMLFILFPAISFAVIAAGVVLFELANYFQKIM